MRGNDSPQWEPPLEPRVRQVLATSEEKRPRFCYPKDLEIPEDPALVQNQEPALRPVRIEVRKRRIYVQE